MRTACYLGSGILAGQDLPPFSSAGQRAWRPIGPAAKPQLGGRILPRRITIVNELTRQKTRSAAMAAFSSPTGSSIAEHAVVDGDERRLLRVAQPVVGPDRRLPPLGHGSVVRGLVVSRKEARLREQRFRGHVERLGE